MAKKKEQKKKAKKKKPKRTKYSRRCATTALQLCTETPDLVKLAKALGVSLSTVYNWRRDHKEFADAIEEGKQRYVDGVEAGFFAVAVPHDEVTEKDGEELVTTTKIGVINVRAAERILEAHRPETYGKKLDVKGAINVNVVDFSHAERADTGS